MKILVPLDGSQYSEKALIHACDLAKNYQACIVLVYVIEKTLPINFLNKEVHKMMSSFGEKVLAKGKKTTIEMGVDSKTILKEGNIVNEIIKLAKVEKCNLIVLGNRGLGATMRLFLGSVSDKLANRAPCSVLIIK